MTIDHEHFTSAVLHQINDVVVRMSLLIVEEWELHFPQQMLTVTVIVQLLSNHFIDAVLVPLSLQLWHGWPISEDGGCCQ